MHYPGHIRQAFVEWVDTGQPAYAWVEVNYSAELWEAKQLLGRMVHCSDLMPAELCSDLAVRPGTTYAAAAQRLLRHWKAAA